ncbi:MAG: 3-dehydrosphinganine reductase [Myxococcota bacterium]|jgi:3-dehydrosphinganine reductase
MDWYRGKKVLITGGSKGIGRATAVRLAGAGAHVVVSARGQAALDETVEAMRAAGGSDAVLGAVAFDVTDRPAVQAGTAKAVELLGGLDLLICNTGYAETGVLAECDEDSHERMMRVNYLGHVNVVRALAPHFVAQGSGDICLVSSMLGFLGLYGYSAYAASKFAIVGFGQALRQEMKLHDVRVTVFYPPTTKTPGLEAENESKPPVVWALESDSGWNKIYEADEVAAGLLSSIRKGTFDAMVGADSKLIYTLARHVPGITRYFADGDLKKAIQKVGAAEGS